jgi:hypothetical protein
MSTVIIELYDALREVGVSEEKARAAAAAVIGAESEVGFATKADVAMLKADIAVVRSEIDRVRSDVIALVADMRTDLIKWTEGTVIAVAVVFTGIFSAIVSCSNSATSAPNHRTKRGCLNNQFSPGLCYRLTRAIIVSAHCASEALWRI